MKKIFFVLLVSLLVIIPVSAQTISSQILKESHYEDNQYELYTEYADCRPWQTCTLELKYNKSIKGSYDYDIKKIIETSTNANDKSYSKDNLPEYELYLGEKYIEKYNTTYFTVEKGQTNKYLDELLEQLDINLDTCLIPNYSK